MNEEVDKAIREAMARYPEKAKSYSETFLKSNMIMNVAQEVSKIVDERDRQLDDLARQKNWHPAIIAAAIRELLQMRDRKGWFFEGHGHWIAVSEVLFEENLIPKVSEKQFITEYCSDKTSPHYILPHDNDQLSNPARIGALNQKGKPVDTAKLMNRAKNKEKNLKGDLVYPHVDLYKDEFRKLLVKHGAIKVIKP